MLRTIRRKRSLAKLRKEVEPVEQADAGSAVYAVAGCGAAEAGGSMRCWMWWRICRGRRCRRVCWRARCFRLGCWGIRRADLDTLIAAGEVVWVGLELDWGEVMGG